jgi:glucosamine kinase
MPDFLPPEFILGVDGGATHCRARLRDRAGRLLGEGRGGMANPYADPDRAEASIRAAIEGALAGAGVDAGDPRLLVGLGVAGAQLPAIEADLRARLRFPAMAIASDAVAACLGAFEGEDGAIFIIGTGTAGLAMAGGAIHTVGGWGFQVADRGSAADLGRRALAHALLAHDGVLARGPLAEAVLARFDGSPERLVGFARNAAGGDFGGFAPLVTGAEANDAAAAALIADAARDIAREIEALARRGARRVSLLGGLAGIYAPLLPPLLGIPIVAPRADAAEGAIILARRHAESLAR